MPDLLAHRSCLMSGSPRLFCFPWQGGSGCPVVISVLLTKWQRFLISRDWVGVACCWRWCTCLIGLHFSPLLLWSHSLKKSQEIHPVWYGVGGAGMEGRCQGCLGRYQCFTQDGCLWAGDLETGALESCLPYGSADLSEFSHLWNGVDLMRPECYRESFPSCLQTEGFENKKKRGVGGVFHWVFGITAVTALNSSRECNQDISHLK